MYSLGQEKNYFPIFDKELFKLFSKLNKKFPLLNFCIWNTKQFNEFMLHQPAVFYNMVETEKNSSEYVFNFLKQSYIEVYYNPNETEIEKYVSNAKTELIYRKMSNMQPKDVLDDIFQTSFCISTRGQKGECNFNELQNGIKRIKSFMFSEKYLIENVIISASKAAYLSAILDTKSKTIETYLSDKKST